MSSWLHFFLLEPSVRTSRLRFTKLLRTYRKNIPQAESRRTYLFCQFFHLTPNQREQAAHVKSNLIQTLNRAHLTNNVL